jgi:DNA adenine methylase
MNMRNAEPKVILPFRWAGGKYYALRKLRPFWVNVEHDEYREPFLGGGAVFWAKPKVKHNWLNDIDKDLIFTLGFIREKKNREKSLRLFEEEKEATREHYKYVKNMVPSDDLSRAYKYYYLNRTSFSGKMRNPTWGYRPKRSLPPYRWKENTGV